MTSPSSTARGRPPAYPFARLVAIGQSFPVPAGKIRSCRAAGNAWAKRHNPIARFTVRQGVCERVK